MTTNPPRDDAPEHGWLIHKAGRGWYRPNAQGYTSDPAQAGRYSHKDAMEYSHPNGWDGPRDEITIKHEREVFRADTPTSAGMGAGIEAAAKWVDDRLSDYVKDHGLYDPTTGVTEFPDGGEYESELQDIADGLRAFAALLPTEAGPPEVQITKLDRPITMDEIEKWDSGCNPTPPAAPTDTALVEALEECRDELDAWVSHRDDLIRSGYDVDHSAAVSRRATAALASRAAPPEAQVTVGDRPPTREEASAAAAVLVAAWDADTLPVTDPDPMLPAFIAALRALAGGEA